MATTFNPETLLSLLFPRPEARVPNPMTGTPGPAFQLPLGPEDELMRQIIEMVSTPEQVQPIEPPREVTTRDRILAGLTDFLGGLAGQPGLAGQRLQERGQQRREVEELNRQRQSQATGQARQNLIQAVTGVLGQRQAARSEERQEQREDERTDADRRFREAMLEREQDFNAREARLDREFRERMARIEASVDPVAARQFAAQQQEALSGARLGVIELKRSLPDELKNKTPSQIRMEALEDFEALGLEGAHLERAIDFFNRHVEPSLIAEQQRVAGVHERRAASKTRKARAVADLTPSERRAMELSSIFGRGGPGMP